jgi:hypothetical protein
MNRPFTPGSPVRNRSQLIGRDLEVERCLSALRTPATNLVVFGFRGAGKTSLATVAATVLSDDRMLPTIKYTCSHGDTYREIFAFYLSESEQLYRAEPTLEVQNRDLHAEATIPFAKGGAKSSNTRHEKISPIWSAGVRPFELASKFLTQDRIFLIDEFDRVRDPETLLFFSDTIKALGDQGGGTRLLLVGVADTARSLLGNHASVARNIRSVGLQGLSSVSIEQILDSGLTDSGLNATTEAKAYVSAVACGLPYVAHLLGSELCLVASRKRISMLTLEHCHVASIEAIHNVFEHVRGTFEDYVFPNGDCSTDFSAKRNRDTTTRELLLLTVAGKTRVEVNELPDLVADLATAISSHMTERAANPSVTKLSGAWNGLLDITPASYDQLQPLMESDTCQPYKLEREQRRTTVSVADPALAALSRLRLAELTSPEWLMQYSASAT